MLPNPYFIYCPPIQTYFVDKDTGAPLSGGVVTFYEDNNRTVLKPIYEQTENPLGTFFYTQLNNPVTLTSVGTFADDNGNDINVFLYPYTTLPGVTPVGAIDLYYVTVYNSGGVLQETRAAWPPNVQIPGVVPIANSVPLTQNELTNPQFVEVCFPTDTSSTTINVSGTGTSTLIAPGWYLQTSGTGTVTVSQVGIGDISLPATYPTSNPPYVLQIQSGGGVTSLQVYQRIYQSPNLLLYDTINGFILASSLSAGSYPITVTYRPSHGFSTNIFTLNTTNDETLTPLQGSVLLSNTNPDIAPGGYVDFVITLQIAVEYQITSCQLTAVSGVGSTVNFLEQSTPLQQSGLFWYWQPQLAFKPVQSLLTAWDFSLNPAQFFGRTTSFTTTAKYVWDQTIMQSLVNTVNVASNLTGAMTLTTTASSEAFYLLQYLSSAEAALTTLSNLSVNILASSTASNVLATVYLCFSASGAIPTLPTSLGTVASTGVFSLTASGWTLVTQMPAFTSSDSLTTSLVDHQFSGWLGKTNYNSGGSTGNFAIVVTFAVPTSGTVVSIESISLTPGDIPTRPGPQTPDEVLRECQYYYEDSYDFNIVPGTSGQSNGAKLKTMNIYSSGSAAVVPYSFQMDFSTAKRSNASTVTLYAVSNGAAGYVDASYYLNTALTTGPTPVQVTASWTLGFLGNKSVTYIATNNTILVSGSNAGATNMNGIIQYHYVCDARLGIV